MSRNQSLVKKAKRLKRSLDQLDLPERRNLRVAAIRYTAGKDRAPKIIATGKGSIAERILMIAEEHNIPFFEDESLAELLTKLSLETEIPPQLYTLIAEILAFVYQLDKTVKKRKKLKK